MAILNYGIKDVVISLMSTTATAWFDPQGEVEREALLQESTGFGVAWQEWRDTGSRKMAPLVLRGIEDFTSSSGSRPKLAEGTTGSLVVTYGGSKTTTVTVFVAKYKTVLATQKLHIFEVTLQPTGTVTEA